MNIGIVGGGTAGPACALFLARAGHRVTMLERVKTPTTIGAGLLIQPTAMLVLQRLGLLNQVLSHGARVRTLKAYIPSGRQVLDCDYRHVNVDAFGLGLHRGALHKILLDAVEVQSGIATRYGVDVQKLIQTSDSKTVLIDAENQSHGPFDLVVCADGARSSLRPAFDDGEQVRKKVVPYDWGGLWVIVRPHDYTPFKGQLTQFYDRTTKFMGYLPTGSAASGSRGLVTLFWSIRCDAVDEWRSKGLDEWKADAMKLSPTSKPLLDQIHSTDQVLLARYWSTHMYPFHLCNTVFIGDAGHSMNPVLGNGANLAMVDAEHLSNCVTRHPKNVNAALNAYSSERRRNVQFYLWASRVVNPLYQSSNPLMHLPRDYLMAPAANLLPWIRSMQERSLVGIQTGFFTRLNPDPVTMFVDECKQHFGLAQD